MSKTLPTLKIGGSFGPLTRIGQYTVITVVSWGVTFLAFSIYPLIFWHMVGIQHDAAADVQYCKVRSRELWHLLEPMLDTSNPAAIARLASKADADADVHALFKRQLISPPSTMECCTCHRGPMGEPGSPGADGQNGQHGLNGEPGLPGKPGLNSDEMFVFPPQCPCEGPVGPPGPEGLKGGPGPDGNPGPDGIDGKDGIPGKASNVKGPPGPPGKHGSKGLPGPPGQITKKRGEPGKIGEPGPGGKQGPPGPSGTPGQDGGEGENGEPGDPGIDGSDGTDGLPGAPGLAGLEGEPGSCDHCPPVRLAKGY